MLWFGVFAMIGREFAIFADLRALRGSKARAKLQTLKLSPHEQLALAFGLENLKPPATIFEE